ncbi:MAG: iron-sulfur cluster insertion protein ErpA [Proteobacteria bacterium]|nr:iron-sulfur cluster insertion protein ErpA [Pseudomonadota bacterium]
MQASAQQLAPPVSLTPAAARRIQELIIEEGNNNLKLRVYITGGGCSGFQYGFAFDEETRPDDCVIEKEVSIMQDEAPPEEEDGAAGSGIIKVNLLIDALSIMYLTGAEIDYIENLQGAHFTVKNPNAQTTCSCGASFSL